MIWEFDGVYSSSIYGCVDTHQPRLYFVVGDIYKKSVETTGGWSMRYQLFAITFACMFFAQVAFAITENIIVKDVELRPNVEVDIHVRVFVNGQSRCRRTIFAVHDFAHTAETWKPFADALFNDNSSGPVVCRVAAINLPGRGDSTLPSGIQYGQLTLDDHVTAIIATLDGLRLRGERTRKLIGHSQGGLLIQMLQQRLAASRSSLRRRFGITHAILLAPALPQPIRWESQEVFGAFDAIIEEFQTSDLSRGKIVDIPDAAFPGVFFSDRNNQLAAGAPTPSEVNSRGYNAPAPLFASLQLAGIEPFSRPFIDPGIFSQQRGTRLFMATYEQDILFRPREHASLYRYLIGADRSRSRFVTVEGPETVHDLHLSDPMRLILGPLGTHL